MADLDRDGLTLVASVVLAGVGMFAGLAATGPRRLVWIRASLLVGSAALAAVAVLWSFGLSEPNQGGGIECSVNPQKGFLPALVLSAGLALAGATAALRSATLRYARPVVVGTSATAVIVLVGSLAYVTAANPSC
jgi:hypothetical protein